MPFIKYNSFLETKSSILNCVINKRPFSVQCHLKVEKRAREDILLLLKNYYLSLLLLLLEALYGVQIRANKFGSQWTMVLVGISQSDLARLFQLCHFTPKFLQARS